MTYDATPAQINENQRDMEEAGQYGECRFCLSRLPIAFEFEMPPGANRPVGLVPVDTEELIDALREVMDSTPTPFRTQRQVRAFERGAELIVRYKDDGDV